MESPFGWVASASERSISSRTFHVFLRRCACAATEFECRAGSASAVTHAPLTKEARADQSFVEERAAMEFTVRGGGCCGCGTPNISRPVPASSAFHLRTTSSVSAYASPVEYSIGNAASTRIDYSADRQRKRYSRIYRLSTAGRSASTLESTQVSSAGLKLQTQIVVACTPRIQR